MTEHELLEKVLNEIENIKAIKDLKNDETHHVAHLLGYYSQLKDGFPDSDELITAKKALTSLHEVHPETGPLIDILLDDKKTTKEKQSNKGEKNKGIPVVDNFNELLKAIKSTINEHRVMVSSGMQDTHECEQYISLLRQYQYSLRGYKDRLNPKEIERFCLVMEKEIQEATTIIEYANSIDSGFTL